VINLNGIKIFSPKKNKKIKWYKHKEKYTYS